jgi:hypothetical protein
MVACPSGKTMSDADVLALSKYLTSKWNLGNTPNSALSRTATGMQPQPGTFTPPVKASFSGVSVQALSVTGGAPSPLTLSHALQTTNNTAMQLMGLPSGAYTFTALVSTSLPYGVVRSLS